MRRGFAAAVLLTACACLTSVAAQADAIYRWKDHSGIVHYGDHVPDAPTGRVDRIAVPATPEAMVRLRIEDGEGQHQAWADNALAGPIEVMLHFRRNDNIAGQPTLPARALVRANGSSLVANLYTVDSTRPGRFEVWMEGIPGDPNAKPTPFEYLVPLQRNSVRIDQGFDGAFSHRDAQNRHALDFAAETGTPVLAARGGVVMQVESDFDQAGLKEKYGGRANFVRILHDDGTMALYAHLQENGVHVRLGQRVRQGQQIGLSGNTGFTSGPHLHYVVQVNRGMRLESIPIRVRGPQGLLNF
ncbi:MAG: M23 family metallopeptidase [Lysobacter sp.]|nr:M23 family metallopeptidase [Lysobacter sp.]